MAMYQSMRSILIFHFIIAFSPEQYVCCCLQNHKCYSLVVLRVNSILRGVCLSTSKLNHLTCCLFLTVAHKIPVAGLCVHNGFAVTLS